MENLGSQAINVKTKDRIFPWKKAWKTLKAIWPQLIYISLLTMSIPQYLLFCISTQKAFQLSQALKIKEAISFEKGLGVLATFAAHYVSLGWIIAVLFVLGCFTAVALTVQTARGEPARLGAAFKAAVYGLFPKGLIFLVLLLIGGLLIMNVSVQVFPSTLVRLVSLILLVLLTALPALMVLESKRPYQAFRKALAMDYARFTGVSKWSIFFLLMTYQLIAMNLIAIVEWLSFSVSDIDGILHWPRDKVFAVSDSFPFGKLIYGAEAVFSFGFAFVVLASVVATTSLVYELYRRSMLGRTIFTSA